MFSFSFIKGLSFGLEYFESETLGFGVNLDLGIIRSTWYRDIVWDEEAEEEQ